MCCKCWKSVDTYWTGWWPVSERTGYQCSPFSWSASWGWTEWWPLPLASSHVLPAACTLTNTTTALCNISVERRCQLVILLTSLTIISQVLQPVLRGLRLLLQPVAVCPAEQISEGDEALFPRKHRRSPAQRLEGKAQFFFTNAVRLTPDIYRVDR